MNNLSVFEGKLRDLCNKEKISEPLLKSVDSCNYGDNLILEIFQIK